VRNKNIYRKYINLQHGQVHLRIAGEKKLKNRPLICFHLSPVSGIIFENWLTEMGQDRLVIAPDTPGFGMSDSTITEPSISDYANIMKSLIDYLDLREIDIMGYHTGSKICVELSTIMKERIKHLVLISAPIYKNNELKDQIKNMGNYIKPQANGSHLIEIWKSLWKWRGPEQTPSDLMKIFPDQIKGGRRTHWGHKAAFAYTYPEVLKEISTPILVLNPNDDLMNFTRRIQTHLINGKILELNDYGHGFLDYNTDEISVILRKFLDHEQWPERAI